MVLAGDVAESCRDVPLELPFCRCGGGERDLSCCCGCLVSSLGGVDGGCG